MTKVDPEQILAKGVATWNEFIAEQQQRDAAGRILLRDIDFTDAKFHKTPLFRTQRSVIDLSGINFANCVLIDCNFEGAVVAGASFLDCEISGCNFSTADLNAANFANSNIVESKFVGATMFEACFASATAKRSDFSFSDMASASLESLQSQGINLSKSDLRNANLQGASFIETKWADAYVAGVSYDRKRLRGRCRGGVGMEAIQGNGIFRRAIMDQDYIDTIVFNLQRQVGLNRLSFFDTPTVFLLTTPFATAWTEVRLTLLEKASILHIFLLPIRLPLKILTSTFSVLLIYIWGIFDFGRSATRIIGFGVIVITGYGFLFQAILNHHIILTEYFTDEMKMAPFFASAGVFLTFGFSGLVQPTTTFGAAVIFSEIILGYFVLGLLVAVLANKFAQRAH